MQNFQTLRPGGSEGIGPEIVQIKTISMGLIF